MHIQQVQEVLKKSYSKLLKEVTASGPSTAPFKIVEKSIMMEILYTTLSALSSADNKEKLSMSKQELSSYLNLVSEKATRHYDTEIMPLNDEVIEEIKKFL